MDARIKISIIIPTYNEAKTIRDTLNHLQRWSAIAEIIVVDGGSTDGTVELSGQDVKLIKAPRGRAVQMNAGASEASGDILLFLHCDTRLPPDFPQQMETALANKMVAGGAFRVQFDQPGLFFYLAALGSNLRAYLSKIYFGDQAIFVRRDQFKKINGFPPMELMEDWEFSRKIARVGKTVLLPGPVTTSSRRWALHGKWKTAFLMHKIKLLYILGATPAQLKRRYSDRR